MMQQNHAAGEIQPLILDHVDDKSAALDSYNAYLSLADKGSMVATIIVGVVRAREMMDPECVNKNKGKLGDMDFCYNQLSGAQKEELGEIFVKAVEGANTAELENIYHKKHILMKVTVFANLTPVQLAAIENAHDESNKNLFSANRLTHYLHIFTDSLLH
jgi:hypothetical protein